jgi:hypothetical protein
MASKMTKTEQRKQLREIAKNLRWDHKVELFIVERQGGDVWPYPIAKAPLITGTEYDCYLVGYRREGFGDNAHFWTEDSISLKLTSNGIVAA